MFSQLASYWSRTMVRFLVATAEVYTCSCFASSHWGLGLCIITAADDHHNA